MTCTTLRQLDRDLVPGDRVGYYRGHRPKIGTVILVNDSGTERLAICWDGAPRDTRCDLVTQGGLTAGGSTAFWPFLSLVDRETWDGVEEQLTGGTS